MRRTYFNKAKGKEEEKRELSDGDWNVDSRFSNMNIDFTWWEKGAKSVVNKSVVRENLLKEYLEVVRFMYRLTDGQVRILEVIYDNRKWWGIMELTDEFEIEISNLVKLSRIKFVRLFYALSKNKKLIRKINPGSKNVRARYMVNWEVLVSPMEMKNCEFVMMSFKLRVEGVSD